MTPFLRPAVAGLLFALAGIAQAQDFPNRTIRVIVPLTPGSGADIVGRIIARKMSESMGQPIVVENRPGGGTQIGTQAVAKAAPDGYTLLVQSSSHAVNPALYKALPYDTLKDFVDVAQMGATPYVMVSSASGPHRKLAGLIEAARAKPGDMAYASAGIGTSTHLVAEYFAQRAQVRLLHVPYKGSAEAIQDTLAGRVAFYMAPVNAAIGHIRDGRLTALGVGTEKPVAILPDVATIASQGVPGYVVNLWFGMWAPAGTPPAVVTRLNAEAVRAMDAADVRDQFTKLGVEPTKLDPAAFAKFVRDEIAVNQRIVADGKIERQ